MKANTRKAAMTQNTISEVDFLARLRAFLADAHGVEPGDLTVEMGSSLRDDLDVDSVASIELTIVLEEEYGIELEDADVFEAASVADLLHTVRGARVD